MKIWKNVLTMALIAMFALGVFAVPHAFAPTSTLTAPQVDDTGLVPDGNPTTSEFSINIKITNVVALVAFNFYVYYDTSVLTAVAGEGYYPFTYPIPITGPVINDAKGSILMGASFPPPETVGKTVGALPFSVARIDFSVDALGASMLDIEGAVFADVNGVELPLTIVDGWFRNVAGVPIAWFAPMDPEIGVPVTFTSTSIDPEGTIVAFDWDWGDGSAHGTTATETHTWTAEGTYAVTLTVTDNDGLTDSQARSIVITPPPLAGAIATKGMYTQKLLDFSKYGSHKQILKGWARNIDPTRSELVRVDLEVWSSNYGQVGAIITPNQWILPGAQALFQGEFDFLDPHWKFVGGRMTYDEFTVYVRVYYADFFYDNDPNNPHWAQVPNGPEVAYTFAVSETAPVPVIAYTYDPTTGIISVDASGSYDLDAKWGDTVGAYRWRLVGYGPNQFGLLEQKFGTTNTFDLKPYGSGTYQLRLRAEDMFGVRVEVRSAKTYFTVP